MPAGGVADKMNFTDIWKAKPPAAAYCHPFNLIWAKNLANMDPGLNPFRGVLDPEMLAMARSRDHGDVTKGTHGSVCDKASRFSAFKPVGLFGNGNESGGYGAHIEEVANNVVNSTSPAISMTPSPPLSDEVEPDIDVTDGMEEMMGNLKKQNGQATTTTATTTTTPTASSLQVHDQHAHQRNSTTTASNTSDKALNNNNDVKAEDTEKAASSCPGHVTKSGNAKNYSVEFLASTENNKVSRCCFIKKKNCLLIKLEIRAILRFQFTVIDNTILII
jgi:hypothetical protein